MKEFTVSVDESHITNGCEFTSVESAELTFNSSLVIQLRKGIEAAKGLSAAGVSAEIRLRNARPETEIEDLDTASYSYDFEYAVVDASDTLVFWYTIGRDYGNWFELIVELKEFEEMEKALIVH